MPPPQYGTGVVASVIAEFVGSFYFVFCSCVTSAYWPEHSESSVIYIALLAGLSFAVVTVCTSEISNGFLNPVVSIALYVTQRLDRLRFFLYLPAQILGGIAGSAFQYVVTPQQEREHKPRTQFADDLDLIQGFVIEFVLSILFVFALFSVLAGAHQQDRPKCGQDTPWKIGLIYTLCLLIDVPYTGGFLNPTWSFGFAVVRNKWGKYSVNHWVYWVAPILGGALGGTLFEIWTTASELNDIQRYSHFKRMVALLVILIMLITVALVITLAV